MSWRSEQIGVGVSRCPKDEDGRISAPEAAQRETTTRFAGSGITINIVPSIDDSSILKRLGWLGGNRDA